MNKYLFRWPLVGLLISAYTAMPALAATPAADIHLTTRQQARLQLSILKARAIINRAATAFPATLAIDPTNICIVSAPIDGRLRAVGNRHFPQLLALTKADSPLAQIMPSLNATELTTLKLLLVKSKANLTAAKISADTARIKFKRDKTLYNSNQAISLQTLEDAQSALAQAMSLYRSDQAMVAAAASWLGGGKQADGIPLVPTHGGELIKLLAHPGQDVTTGQKLFEIWNPHRLLVRTFLPLNYSLPPHFHLKTYWHGHPLHLTFVGIAGHASKITGGAVMVACMQNVAHLRAGMPITVWLTSKRRHPEHGYFIPQRAMVWWGGARWVFAKVSTTTFSPIRLVRSHPAPGGRFVPQLPPHARLLVVRGAQYLLSMEQSYSLKKSG